MAACNIHVSLKHDPLTRPSSPEHLEAIKTIVIVALYDCVVPVLKQLKGEQKEEVKTKY